MNGIRVVAVAAMAPAMALGAEDVAKAEVAVEVVDLERDVVVLVLLVEAMGLVPMVEAAKALVPRVVAVKDQVPMVQGTAGRHRSHNLGSDTNCNERHS